MKIKVPYFYILFGILSSLISCSSGATPEKVDEVPADSTMVDFSPGNTILEFTEYLKDGQYEKVANILYLNEQIPEEQHEKTIEIIINTMQEAAELMKMENGGLEKVEIISESISESGDSATVKAKIFFGNGISRESSVNLLKVDGKWKYKMGF
ncbi:MAG: DUF4878 domain-containing protein [Candidatus Azobacteroides sp.]|nr:DUF4878 domain-containing protein [Candidatus Azobacteroides sp.]